MAARLVAAQIIMLPEFDHHKKIACYYPIKEELDCLVVMKALHAARFSLSLPIIVGTEKPLAFRLWDMRSDLLDGPFGTKEPVGAEEEPEIILAPMVAFDGKGARLGYGGGYYDRTIEGLRLTNPSIVVIGLAFENQKLASIPVDSYDQPMDMVITEKTTYRFS